MPFTFTPLEIPEVLHITSKSFADERGAFVELFKASDFKGSGIEATFLQINQSISKKNVIRGLHYQKNPHAQGKLVGVMEGEIFDVAVDMRTGSNTFGKWVSATLSADKENMLYIPAGFAHGFCVVSDEAKVVYFCTQEYAKDAERGLMWNDPAFAIPWPTQTPILSPKDTEYPAFADADNNFSL